MSKKIKVLVTGANGQLGNECKVVAQSYPNFDCVFVNRDELPIDDFDKTALFFSMNQFDACVNCAAYTAVDKAESDEENAMKINATAVGHLATICNTHKVRLIHISTDYVFDGENQNGYFESDQTNPLNIYGLSKLKGEHLAIANNPNAIIIRTSWVYSSFGKNFVKTMMKLMQEKESINVVNDQIGSPTYAFDLAQAIFKIISSDIEAAGIFNFSNNGVISWFEFAQAIKDINRYTCIVNPIPSSDYPVPAKRPRFSILNTKKIQDTFGVDVPNWNDSLKQCLKLLN